uniref:HMG box domain-containing protein n=1 Tax=Mycena chlorophos TaxID=658473 RepID=A0ABQ0LC27_MYCCL|nr:predicted protein [Mycena chlorophos]
MTTAQRAPWVLLAEEEKKRHAILYPGYKYMPRNRKAPPTEAFVKKQFLREANRVVARERKAQEEEDLRGTVTIYYPPWATRRARVIYGRRATSCPPPGAVAVTPYSERVDRACVTVHDSRPSSPVSDADSDIFLPLIEVPCKPSWEVQPDEELSRPAIENPVGTHWGTVPASPTDYRMQGDVPVMQPKESYYVPRRHTQTLSEDMRYRPVSSSTSAGSTTPPPRTPTDVDFIAPLVYAGNNHIQQDFVTEFGSMLQAVPVVSPRESFLRTTYTNAFEGYE